MGLITRIILLVLTLALKSSCKDILCSQIITLCNDYETVFCKTTSNGNDLPYNTSISEKYCNQYGFQTITYKNLSTTCNLIYSCNK